MRLGSYTKYTTFTHGQRLTSPRSESSWSGSLTRAGGRVQECLESKVQPDTLNALLCLQAAAELLNYSQSSCLSIRETSALRTGVSALGAPAVIKQADLHELTLPPLPRVCLGPENASRGPSTIHYFLTDGLYIGEDLPVPLRHSPSFLRKKKIFLTCSVTCHWLETQYECRCGLTATFHRCEGQKINSPLQNHWNCMTCLQIKAKKLDDAKRL